MMDKLFVVVLLMATMKPCFSQSGGSEGRPPTSTHSSLVPDALNGAASLQGVAFAVNVNAATSADGDALSDVTTVLSSSLTSSPAGTALPPSSSSSSSSTAAAEAEARPIAGSGTDAGNEAGPQASTSSSFRDSSSPPSASSTTQSTDDGATSLTTVPSATATVTRQTSSDAATTAAGAGEGLTAPPAVEITTTVREGAGDGGSGGGGRTESSAGDGSGRGGGNNSTPFAGDGSSSLSGVSSVPGDSHQPLQNSSQTTVPGSALSNTSLDSITPASSDDSYQPSLPPSSSTAVSIGSNVNTSPETQPEDTESSSSVSSLTAVPSTTRTLTTTLGSVSSGTNSSVSGGESFSPTTSVLVPLSSNDSSTQGPSVVASTTLLPTYSLTGGSTVVESSSSSSLSPSWLPGETDGTEPTQSPEFPSTSEAATNESVGGSTVTTSMTSTHDVDSTTRTTLLLLTTVVNTTSNSSSSSSTGAVTDAEHRSSSQPSHSSTRVVIRPTTTSRHPTPTATPPTASTSPTTTTSTTPMDNTAPQEARYLLILSGDCGLVLNNTEFFSRFLAGLHDLIVKQFRVAPGTYRIGDISCGSVRVYVTFTNVIMPDFDFLIQSVVQNGGQGLSVPVWIDSHFATFDLYHAQHVPLSPDERTFRIVTEVMDDVDIIVIIVACCVCGILIAIGVAICAKECYRRKHAQSFNLLEVPHVNLKLEDFTLTRIPRPKTVFTAHPHDHPPDPVKSFNIGDEAGTSRIFHSEPATNCHHSLAPHTQTPNGDGSKVCNGNSNNGSLGPAPPPRDLHLRVSQHSDGIIVGVTASPTFSASSPKSRSSHHQHPHAHHHHRHHHNGDSQSDTSAVNSSSSSATNRQGRQLCAESGSPRFKARTRTPAADDFSAGEYQASERLLDGSCHHGDDVEGGTVNPVFVDDPEAAPDGMDGVAGQCRVGGGGDRGGVGDAS